MSWVLGFWVGQGFALDDFLKPLQRHTAARDVVYVYQVEHICIQHVVFYKGPVLEHGLRVHMGSLAPLHFVGLSSRQSSAVFCPWLHGVEGLMLGWTLRLQFDGPLVQFSAMQTGPIPRPESQPNHIPHGRSPRKGEIMAEKQRNVSSVYHRSGDRKTRRSHPMTWSKHPSGSETECAPSCFMSVGVINAWSLTVFPTNPCVLGLNGNCCLVLRFAFTEV